MQTDLIPFQFNGHDVPAIRDEKGEPWWKAADVCEQCGIKNVSKACERLDTDEKAVITLSDSAGRPQDMLIVNEAGLYALALRSRKPEAGKFKRWVTHEVLPQIRKTGQYTPTVPQVKNPAHQLLIDAVVRIDTLEQEQERQRAQLLEQQSAVIASQQQAIEALQQAREANAKAEIAMERSTVESFILGNKLLPKFPMSDWARIGTWLGNWCNMYGLEVIPVPVVGKPWPTEHSYPLAAFAAWLRHEQRKPQQIRLVNNNGD